MTEQQASLFELDTETSGGAITRAAQGTIRALEMLGTLDPTHALKVELIMTGARALDIEFSRNKVTIAAMQLFSKVVDIADGLPTVQQAVSEAWDQVVEALADAD